MRKALYILAELSNLDFNWLLNSGVKVQVPAGTTLIQEGQVTDALYIILEGSLAVCVEALDNQEVARLANGEVVGEMSFVDSRPPSATVKAIEDTTVWAIPRPTLAFKLNQDVGFAAHFYHAIALFLSDRMRETVNRLTYQNQGSELDKATSENTHIISKLDIATSRFNGLLEQLKEAPSYSPSPT